MSRSSILREADTLDVQARSNWQQKVMSQPNVAESLASLEQRGCSTQVLLELAYFHCGRMNAMTAEFKRKEASHRAEGKRLARELNDLAERLAKFNASEFVKGPARRRGVRAAAALRRADEQTREYVLQIEGLYNRLPAHLQRIGLYLKLTQKKSCITPEVRAETDFYLVALYLYIRHVTGAKRFFHREVEALIYAGQEAFGKEKPPSNPDTFRIDFSRYRRRWPVHYDALDHLTAQYFRLDSNRRGSSYGHWLLSRWRARLTRTF